MQKYARGYENREENTSAMTKVRNAYQGFCIGLDKYSDAFKLIPTNNMYVGIISGVLTTVVKVKLLLTFRFG